MPFQSSKRGAVGSSGGMAPIRLSGTNWNRPSKRRSARSTCASVRQAAWLASSGRLGTHSGTAKRGAAPSITICSTGAGSCGGTGARRGESRARRSRGEECCARRLKSSA